MSLINDENRRAIHRLYFVERRRLDVIAAQLHLGCSAVRRAIGRPRSGWGPEMKPFGHSILGEPLIPVDAHREIVRVEAAAMGIPLRDSGLPRNGAFDRHGPLHFEINNPT